jgi:hypothetical protein
MGAGQVAGWTLSAGGSGATIDITLLVGKQVQISDTVVVRGGHNVTWTITNSSGASEEVRIEDFCLKNAGAPQKPILDTPLDKNQKIIDFGQISDGATEARATKIKAPKPDHPGAWVYKYTLVIGRTRIDPEIVVEWP